METKKQKPDIRCTYCDKGGFESNSRLKRHQVVHTGERFSCNLCPKSYAEKASLTAHQRVHTGEMFQCTVCPKSFTRRHNFIAHQRLHTGNLINCKLCEKAYPSEKALKQHMEVHLVLDKPFKCKLCPKSFRNLSLLRRHNLVHSKHLPETFKCDLCQKSLRSKVALLYHAEAFHSELKVFSCTLCDGKYKSERCLKAHMKSKHFSSRPICPSKRFIRIEKDIKQAGKEDVTTDKTDLMGDDPLSTPSHYYCAFCDKVYFKSRDLILHLRVHLEEKPYSCYFCKKAFTCSTSRRFHLRVHTRERQYHCSICKKDVWSARELLEHQITHPAPGVKTVAKLSCYFCPRLCINQSSLFQHIRTHLNERHYRKR